MTPLRNLLIISVNEIISKGCISLNCYDDSREEKYGHIHTTIAGRKSVIIWSEIPPGEVRVSVWWDYLHEQHPQANSVGNSKERFTTSRPLAKSQHYPKFLGAMVSGWLERKEGKYLQGKENDGLFHRYIRRSSKKYLEDIPLALPVGFKETGKFHY